MPNSDSSEMIVLSGLTPIGSGGHRDVYDDPRFDDQLIKVLKPDAAYDPKGLTFVAKYLKINTNRRKVVKEIDEAVRVTLVSDMADGEIPIAQFRGLVPTDLGVGAVTEKVTDLQGHVGPTLPSVAKERDLTDDEVAALSRFAQRLFALHVRASDMTARNIVLGYRGTAGDRGPLEAVLIDGFGDMHAIPIRTWSRWANRRATERKLVKVARKVRLIWESDAEQFVRA